MSDRASNRHYFEITGGKNIYRLLHSAAFTLLSCLSALSVLFLQHNITSYELICVASKCIKVCENRQSRLPEKREIK